MNFTKISLVRIQNPRRLSPSQICSDLDPMSNKIKLIKIIKGKKRYVKTTADLEKLVWHL